MILYVFGTLLLLVMALTLAMAFSLLLRGRRHYVRQKLIKAQRRGETYEDFRRYFAGQGIPGPLLRAIYALFSHQIALVADFPVRPLDSLYSLYGIEGFSGTSRAEVVEALGVDMALCDGFEEARLRTVADLVLWIASSCQAVTIVETPPQITTKPLSERESPTEKIV